MILKRVLFSFLILLAGTAIVRSQDNSLNPTVHGNFQIDVQTYHKDKALNITDSSLLGKELRMNGYGDVRISMWRFNAGIRYEAYLPPLDGYDAQYQGQGIPYWFVDYGDEKLQVTAGHFYEQFGMGMILRSYQQWDLGYDNSLNGLRVKYSPIAGMSFKALIGTQRYYWQPFENDNRGIVRGFDGELTLNDAIKKMNEAKTRITLGGSFVSKYEKMKTKTTVVDTIIYEYQLPENVASAAGRINISNGGFNFYSEYVHKFNNPSAFNDFIYKPGEAFLASLSYSQKGLGVYVAAKRIDNMSYKSKMTELNNVLDINFIPPLTKQYIYTLENLYPYATQLNGEAAIQGQFVYTIKKGSKLGGKYGTKLEVNYSLVHGLDMQPVDGDTVVGNPGTHGYKAPWFKFGDLYYQGFTFTFEKKISKKFKITLEYLCLKDNVEVVEGEIGEDAVKGHGFTADLTWKITTTKSLRFETEFLFTNHDIDSGLEDFRKGDWAMLLIEFNIAPKWFFSFQDQYNFGNPWEENRLHYYTAAMAFVQGPHRIALSYGRQREGLLCVGGVCRQVPASNGFTLNISTSF